MSALSRYVKSHDLGRHATVATDQTVGLPSFPREDIPAIRTELNTSNFDAWFKEIWRILQRRHFCSLVHVGIPRPCRENDGSEWWAERSTIVRNWLERSMQKELAQEINAACWDKAFADEFMDKTILLCWKRNPIRHIQRVAQLLSIAPAHFHSAKAFARSFKERFNKLTAEDDTCISPYFAMCMGLARLQEFKGFVVPSTVLGSVRVLATDFERGNCTNFAHSDFNVLFSKLIAELPNAS